MSDIDDLQLGELTPSQAWAGEFGDAYTARNRVDWRKRVPFWTQIMDITGARSVLEVGCNAGWNLSAIGMACAWTVNMAGLEPNKTALFQARAAGLDVYPCASGPDDRVRYELAFTAGVLIHVPPDQIERQMQDIVAASCDYVLAVEYAAPTETEIEYRGQRGLLWKRPYGKMYQDMGLKLTHFGDVDKEHGFDNCTWWLLRK